MKLKRSFYALFIICCICSGFAFSQDKSSNGKDKNPKQKPVEIKANVLITDSSAYYADGIKAENVKVFEDEVEQKITYFAKKELILNVGLVIDNSGSMRTSLNEITAAGLIFVANLAPKDEAFIVRFVSSDKVEIVQDWTSNKAELKEGLDNMYIDEGQSAVLDAIYLSAEKVLERQSKDKSKNYALVLISDAEERDSYYKTDEILKPLKDSGLQMFLLSYAENAPLKKKKAVNLSRLLTLETGGTVYLLDKKHTKEDVIEAVKKLIFELRAQYIIGYTSTNQKRDGLPRKLRVEVADGAKGEKRKGLIREGFIVPKD
ncbi:MAG TPA: VWA domain-containing protein [Pyrinomonadaceae bacterium]|nr:VWA domain-containing protein [Pyrinomonadaceae bacterium]